ncbi:hypothetical protein Pcinc_018158 [Petrolisthes cinctipes]|uniref:Uncharacterized protein n=1 Tax=Petrolisthes cinctipes TaxID=88211 RepID=A0AAE1FNP3_PETCI|nr:hypothetical protein Pcinc_018158 [Petrolisthes cinctipes]
MKCSTCVAGEEDICRTRKAVCTWQKQQECKQQQHQDDQDVSPSSSTTKIDHYSSLDQEVQDYIEVEVESRTQE